MRFFCNVDQAVSGLFLLASSLEQLDIVTISAAVTQGRTYRVDIDDWMRWSREPERLGIISIRVDTQYVTLHV